MCSGQDQHQEGSKAAAFLGSVSVDFSLFARAIFSANCHLRESKMRLRITHG
jgi:hypothetical protein